eukprot:jgi/Galph1/4521/GphlegSOOS_G3200.1
MGFIQFCSRTAFSGKHKEIYPLLGCVSFALFMGAFLSVDQLLHNPTVVWKKSERQAYARNELDKEERWSIKFLRMFRGHSINVFDPLNLQNKKEEPH